MKKIKLLGSYSRNVRFSIVVLVLMMLVVLYMVIDVVGQICYIRASYDLVSGSARSPDQLYVFQSWGSSNRSGKETAMDIALKAAKSDPAVSTYCVYYTAWVSYHGQTTNLVLYDREMIDLFPILQQNGVIFTEPMGCVVGGEGFENTEPGDKITLEFRRGEVKNIEFPVNGKLTYPNLYFSLSETTTDGKTADSMISPGSQIIIMEANADVLVLLDEVAMVRNTTNFIFAFEAGTPDSHKEEFINKIRDVGLIVPFTEVLKNTEIAIQEKYVETLPIPLFLLLVSTTAFFSTMILIFKKKEQELAINFLCGASRKECITTVIVLFSIIALIPTLVGIGYVLYYPYIERPGYIPIPELIIDWRCILVVLAYYVLTQAFAAFAVWLQMRSHTPLGLLRGTEL